MNTCKIFLHRVQVVVFFLNYYVTKDKRKHMVMCRDQKAGRSHSMKTDNSSFERVEEFR